MYYALGHFSRFLGPGSQRIDTEVQGIGNLQTIAFQNENNATVLIALNQQIVAIPLTINDPNLGTFTTTVPPLSIQTYVWY